MERLEEIIRAKGNDPGIHSHTDTTNIDLSNFATGSSNTCVKGSPAAADMGKNLQPVSIYMTKAGAPIDKKRNARPESVPTTSEEDENAARMRKFKVT